LLQVKLNLASKLKIWKGFNSCAAVEEFVYLLDSTSSSLLGVARGSRAAQPHEIRGSSMVTWTTIRQLAGK
jgi:hypothetical protein